MLISHFRENCTFLLIMTGKHVPKCMSSATNTTPQPDRHFALRIPPPFIMLTVSISNALVSAWHIIDRHAKEARALRQVVSYPPFLSSALLPSFCAGMSTRLCHQDPTD